jgi:hypothetical protein
MNNQHARVDRTDPTIAAFLMEIEGSATTPVAIKLTGESEADVALQIHRLERAFGSLVTFTMPRRVSNGVEWIAHGTLLG